MVKLIFVTGGSGFVGSHIITELLKKGYRVRAAVRPASLAKLTSWYPDPSFEAVVIKDLAQYLPRPRSVEGIVHAASPMPGTATIPEILNYAIEITLNLVRQAHKAGINKIIVSTSMFAIMRPGGTMSAEDWNPITMEEALALTDTRAAYRASKTLAEKALWQYGREHPELDITTVIAPFVFGPFPYDTSGDEPNLIAISTNIYVYRFLTQGASFPVISKYADVRDVAAVHVGALEGKPSSTPKRLLIGSIEPFDFKHVLDLIRQKRPALAARLNQATPPEVPLAAQRLDFDQQQLKDVCGIEKYRTLEETFLDTVDCIIEFENAWKAKGIVVDVPLVPQKGL
ncbi:hypothetical protein C8J56DRAFT_1021775 [Mycena floridula]|nr:hypothetical protein C8J56DRAFT_1021775 [Mycena floridula]